ncbi:MAG: response regulator [Thermoanaerobacteraceae bacterium]|nr:response regulator [Thermoanaerobacteraceae bacterium]
MEPIRVVIVDDVEQTRQDISRLLYFEEDISVVGEAGTGEEAIEIVKHTKPDVVLMDINMPGMDGIRATEEITMRFPETKIIIISIQGEQEYLKKAMMAGAREYLIKPFSGDEVASTIRQVNKLRRHGFVDEGREGKPEEKRLAKIIAVFSGKGGVGKSFVATNLSVVLGLSAKVALMDLDVQFGDVALMLGLSSKRSLEHLLEEEVINWDVLQGYMLYHLSGVQVLPGLGSVENSEKITRELIEQVVRCLRTQFDYLILDLTTGFNDINLYALEVADTVIQIVTPDILSLKAAKNTSRVLEALEIGHKVQLVENFAERDGAFKKQMVEKTLESTMVTSIPYDEKSVLTSVNKGVPPTLVRSNSTLNRAFETLAAVLAGKETVNGAKRGLIRKIFSF